MKLLTASGREFTCNGFNAFPTGEVNLIVSGETFVTVAETFSNPAELSPLTYEDGVGDPIKTDSTQLILMANEQNGRIRVILNTRL